MAACFPPAQFAGKLAEAAGAVGAQSSAARRDARSEPQPLGGAGGQPMDLGHRQGDNPVDEQWSQLGDGEHAVGGHHLTQPPLVADLAFHHVLPRGSNAAARVSFKARRRVRVRKSDDTQVYSDVVLGCSCPHWNWTNSGFRPA